MMIDLSKLTPAPWRIDEFSDNETTAICGPGSDDHVCIIQHGDELAQGPSPTEEVNAEFIALARNALDVQMRREWFSVPDGFTGRWKVATNLQAYKIPMELWQAWEDVIRADNPFTALVHADKWYAEHIEVHR